MNFHCPKADDTLKSKDVLDTVDIIETHVFRVPPFQ
jgi:hypothetical protein